ncbi:hypothetical protein BofuT4_uP139640.1 [Botrytis cinerea T4]|uniref:Uncharacterized protein n=1 Tax=Botryotinia fuckeliana (strain T4) TaxID=999810 RepID=G2YN42_BOTF4|nr:hypothetical protein BofuT4_uP139640.1 [Botrytis cinerea T4]
MFSSSLSSFSNNPPHLPTTTPPSSPLPAPPSPPNSTATTREHTVYPQTHQAYISSLNQHAREPNAFCRR